MHNAGNLDIRIDQGATFTLPFQLLDVNGDPVSLSGATIRGSIRENIADAAAIVSFTGAVTDAEEGEGNISLTAAQTAAMVEDASPDCQRNETCYLWDCEVVYSDLTVQRILQGNAYLNPEVSQ